MPPWRLGLTPLAFLLLPSVLGARDIQDVRLAQIPEGLASTRQKELTTQREALVARVRSLNAEVDKFMAKCGHIPAHDTALVQSCLGEQAQLETERKGLIEPKRHFNESVIEAVFALRPADFDTSVIAKVPGSLPPEQRSTLIGERAQLIDEAISLDQRMSDFTEKCRPGQLDGGNTDSIVSCGEEPPQLLSQRTRLADRVQQFNGRVMPPMNTEAARMVAILDRTSRKLNLPKAVSDQAQVSRNCQAFFRGVASELTAAHKASWEDDFAGLDADGIVRRVESSAQTGGKWEKVQGDPESVWRTAQELADRGVIVIGGSERDASGSGHLGFVFPRPPGLDESRFAGEGRGPFVRDGNQHRETHAPSGWGAVRASRAFVLSRTSWYVWVPSKQQGS